MRVSQHYVGIRSQSEHKYRLLAEAQRHGYKITFDVLYDAEHGNRAEIEETIG